MPIALRSFRVFVDVVPSISRRSKKRRDRVVLEGDVVCLIFAHVLVLSITQGLELIGAEY